jgi:hypothetical protein
MLSGGGAPERAPAADFAELRGLTPRSDAPADAAMIAASWDAWDGASADTRRAIAARVGAGAILHLGGAMEPRNLIELAPFAERAIGAVSARAASIVLTADPLIPRPLRCERLAAAVDCVGAGELPATMMPLMLAHPAGAPPVAVVFAIQHGAGFVICDTVADDGGGRPIFERLSDPAARTAAIGALIASELASGRDLEDPGTYNLTLDDRPANLDYFSLGALRDWLSHTRAIAPDAWLDCGWTPDQNRPLRRYVDTLKRFGAGFAWHGFLHHIDHSKLEDPAADYARGRELMRDISRRYGVEIQPVMIFPFERRSARALRCARDAGFVCSAENAQRHAEDETNLPEHLRFSTPLRLPREVEFPVLRRYPGHYLDRDRMLAVAALGLPLIAVAHPWHFGLRRSPLKNRKHPRSVGYFDHVLAFALEKKLRPRSLTDIAHEAGKWPEPQMTALN